MTRNTDEKIAALRVKVEELAAGFIEIAKYQLEEDAKIHDWLDPTDPQRINVEVTGLLARYLEDTRCAIGREVCFQLGLLDRERYENDE